MQAHPRTKYALAALSGFLILWITGCGIPTPSAYTQRVNQARQQWQAHGITNYRIVLSYYESFTAGRKSQREVVVKQDKVARSSCNNNLCPAYALANVYTVDDLFGKVYAIPEKCAKHLTFDAAYGFPNSASVDCPDMIDDEHSVKVVSFEVLKEDNSSK